MSVRERVARQWHSGSDHAAESPFGGPLCNCDRVADRMLPMLRDAWDEGRDQPYECCGMCPINKCPWDKGGSGPTNPYREGDRHVDQ